jgi:hypothetical protein
MYMSYRERYRITLKDKRAIAEQAGWNPDDLSKGQRDEVEREYLRAIGSDFSAPGSDRQYRTSGRL